MLGTHVLSEVEKSDAGHSCPQRGNLSPGSRLMKFTIRQKVTYLTSVLLQKGKCKIRNIIKIMTHLNGCRNVEIGKNLRKQIEMQVCNNLELTCHNR